MLKLRSLYFLILLNVPSALKAQDQQIDPSLVYSSYEKDKEFCDGYEPNQCFTLLVRVPPSSLINDIGLALLNIGREEESGVRDLFLRKCDEGIKQYGYHTMFWGQIRREFFLELKDSRCMIQYLTEENDELPDLGPDHKTISVRLASFDITSFSSVANLGPASYNADKSRYTVTAEELMVHTKVSNNNLGMRVTKDKEWTYFPMLSGPLGIFLNQGQMEEITFSSKNRMKFGFYEKSALKLLASVIDEFDTADSESLRQLTKLLRPLKDMPEENLVDPNSTLAFAGFGIQLVNELCKRVECTYDSKDTELTEELRDILDELSSLTAGNYRSLADGFVLFPEAILNRIFIRSDRSRLKKLLEYYHPSLTYQEEDEGHPYNLTFYRFTPDDD